MLEGSNGEALQIGGQHKDTPIHLLITDVVMPGMSGHDLAASLELLRTGMKFL